MGQFRAKLEPKTTTNLEGRKPGPYKWYEIQDNVAYFNDFEKEKILYPNMTAFMPFVYDEDGYFSNDKSFIITGNSLKWLVCFLNSTLFKFTFKDIFPELLGGTRELRKVFFETVEVKELLSEAQKPFEVLVNQILSDKKAGKDTAFLESEIDRLVYELYELTEAEIAVVEGK